MRNPCGRLSAASRLTRARGVSEPTAIEVPYTALSGEALDRLMEEFVTRDGTYYGDAER